MPTVSINVMDGMAIAKVPINKSVDSSLPANIGLLLGREMYKLNHIAGRYLHYWLTIVQYALPKCPCFRSLRANKIRANSAQKLTCLKGSFGVGQMFENGLELLNSECIGYITEDAVEDPVIPIICQFHPNNEIESSNTS